MSVETPVRTVPTPATGIRTALPSLLRRAAPALALFAAARLTGALAVALGAVLLDRNPFAVLGTSWDSRWYLSVAAYGYGHKVRTFDPGIIQLDVAFFPLYPALIRALTTVLPLSGGAAGLLVSWTSAVVAALGVYLAAERLRGPRTATALVLLWGLLPHAAILTLAYTEPLLVAFAAWSLYAVLTRRWLTAALLAVLAGLSRPSGVAVAAAVCVAAGCALWRRRATWRTCAAAVLAPLGWLSYVLWVGARRGDLLGGYFTVQRMWGSRFDHGVGTVLKARDILMGRPHFTSALALLLLAGALVLLVLLFLERPRLPLPVLAYTAVLFVITVGGAGFFESKPRFLLPAFPLLLPLAAAMARARLGTVVVVTVALAGLSWSYGAYLLVLSPMPL